MYIIAILLPPLALAACGKLWQAVLCIPLMLFIVSWPIASIWAVLEVANEGNERRHKEMLRAMRRRGGGGGRGCRQVTLPPSAPRAPQWPDDLPDPTTWKQ